MAQNLKLQLVDQSVSSRQLQPSVENSICNAPSIKTTAATTVVFSPSSQQPWNFNRTRTGSESHKFFIIGAGMSRGLEGLREQSDWERSALYDNHSLPDSRVGRFLESVIRFSFKPHHHHHHPHYR